MPNTAPQVPIEVDSVTGIWTTDGLPMIYLPRHFYVNHHIALEAAFGREALGRVLYEAGYLSAWQWCEKESVRHGLSGLDVFRHYMTRLSQRGWGRFSVAQLDEVNGHARIHLDYSIYVEHNGSAACKPLCYAFAGWFPGSLDWAGRNSGHYWKLEAEEVQCAGMGVHNRCVFEVRPRTT